MSDSEYSLYIVRCADGSLYTGIAVDVSRRMREHESGTRGAKYLRGRAPLQLEFAQTIGDRSAASRAEYQVKCLEKEAKEALIDGQHSLGDLLANALSDGGQASGPDCG